MTGSILQSGSALSPSQRTSLDNRYQKKSVALVRSDYRPHSPDTLRATVLTVTDASASTIASAQRFSLLKPVTLNLNSTITATVASGLPFEATDVGKEIGASANIAAGTTIISQTGSACVLSQVASGTANNVGCTINRVGPYFRVYGATTIGRVGSTFPSFQCAYPNYAATPSISDNYILQGSFYGQKFEVVGLISNGTPLSQIRVWVDEGNGWQATTAGVYNPTASGSLRYILFDFTTTAHRRIRIECATSLKVYAIYCGPTDTWWRGDGASPVRVAFMGDSYFEGNYGGNTARFTTPWGTVSKLMGWGDPLNRGQGGTGWLNNGQGVRATNDILRNRLTEVISTNPDGWVIAMGVNDTSFTQTQIYNEATYVLQQLKANLPNAFGYVVGPWCASSLSSTTLANISAGIKQACIEQGYPFIDPQSSSVYSATGTQIVVGNQLAVSGGHTATTTNGGVFMHTDDLHMTQAGYDFMGRFIAAGVQAIESMIGYGRI